MMKPGTHGVSVGTDTQNTAKRFRRSAYALGSARVRSRYSHDPGPSPIPPGGDSFGSFAAKLGSAVLAGRNNREFRDQERQNATLADEKNTLELEALRQKLAPGKNHYLTAEGKGLDLSDEQAALYEHRNREREPAPRQMVKLSRAFPELGYKAGQEVDPSELSAAGSLYRNAHPRSGGKPRYGQVNSVLSGQERESYRRVDDHVTKKMSEWKPFADQWLNAAINGDGNAIARLGLDPRLVKKMSGPAARTALQSAHDRLTKQHREGYRAEALKMHGSDLERVRKARTELGAAVGDEAGIDLGGEEESAVRPEIQALIDRLGRYAPR